MSMQKKTPAGLGRGLVPFGGGYGRADDSTEKLPPVDFLRECFNVNDENQLVWKLRPAHHFTRRPINGAQSFIRSLRQVDKVAGSKTGYVRLEGKAYRVATIIKALTGGVA